MVMNYTYGKFSQILNALHFLFSNKMLVFTKCSVRIANRVCTVCLSLFHSVRNINFFYFQMLDLLNIEKLQNRYIGSEMHNVVSVSALYNFQGQKLSYILISNSNCLPKRLYLDKQHRPRMMGHGKRHGYPYRQLSPFE